MAVTNSPHPRVVPCTDAVGRQRRLETWTTPPHGAVVVRVPPGEVALLTPHQARALRDDLDQQATLVEAQHTGPLRERDGKTVSPSGSSPVDLRGTLVADGWALQVEPPDSLGVIGVYRVGAGYRDFMVTDEAGTGAVFGGRWFAASNLTWIRQVDGWREMTRLLDAFPDEPAAPWIPVDADELLAMLQQRQAELTRTQPPPDHK